MIIRAFITHKKAEKFTDCQDRFGVNVDTKSISVSDGMGSTWQQKIWAQLLVKKFTSSNEWMPTTHESIKQICFDWRQKVEDFIQGLKDNNTAENIIYRNERCLADGRSAGATFVGIRFKGLNWSGVVLGDSCLIEWGDSKAEFYTSQSGEGFDNFPDYFDSNAERRGRGEPRLIDGTIKDGGVLLLVSDPFSEFLFKHYKNRDINTYIDQLLKLTSHDEFESVVELWRSLGMNNDDTTLVIIEYDGVDDLKIVTMDDINAYIESEDAESTEKQKELVETEFLSQEKNNSEFQKKDTIETLESITARNPEYEFVEDVCSCLRKMRMINRFKFKKFRKNVLRILDKYSIKRNY